MLVNRNAHSLEPAVETDPKRTSPRSGNGLLHFVTLIILDLARFTHCYNMKKNSEKETKNFNLSETKNEGFYVHMNRIEGAG